MPLRIAYLTSQYMQVSLFNFVHREVDALRKLGVHVETFSVRDTDSGAAESDVQREERKSTYFLFPYPLLDLVSAHTSLFFTSPGRYFRTLKLAFDTRQEGLVAHLKQFNYFLEGGLVARRMRRRRLTHLHNHFAASSCTVAMLAAEIGGFTFSFTIHGSAIFYHPRKWRIDEKAKRALFVLCISQFSMSQTRVFAPIEAWNRMRVVHMGVDPALYTPKTHAGPGSKMIFTGRIVAEKGLPILFEAMMDIVRRVPDAKLTLIGDGEHRPWLEDFARTHNLAGHVEFLGYQPQSVVRQRLAEADVFVLPSFAEGLPVVVVEAMATGVPAVSTRVMGIPELVDDGVNGFLVTPGDVEQLADRVVRLLSDGGLRDRMGQAGRRKIEAEFDTHREAEKILAILEEFLLHDS